MRRLLLDTDSEDSYVYVEDALSVYTTNADRSAAFLKLAGIEREELNDSGGTPESSTESWEMEVSRVRFGDLEGVGHGNRRTVLRAGSRYR